MEGLSLLISYAALNLPLVFAVLFGLFASWIVTGTSSQPTVWACVSGVAFLVETVFMLAPSIPIGINVSSNDLACALLVATLPVRVLLFKSPPPQLIFWMWLSIGGVLLISFGVGLTFGSVAGVEARANFYFWVVGLYFASYSHPPAALKRLWHIVQWCAWLVAARAIYRWVGVKYGFVSESMVVMASVTSEFRVVIPSSTCELGVIGLAYCSLWLRHTSRPEILGDIPFQMAMIQHEQRVQRLEYAGISMWRG